MFAKLEGLEKKYMELEQQLSQPGIYNDQEQFKKLSKAHADLKDVVDLFRPYRSAKEQIEENKQLLHEEGSGPGGDQEPRSQASRDRASAQGAAHPQRSARREEHHP